MKKLFILLIMASTTIAVQAQDSQNDLTGMVKIEVDGLSCPFCAYGLEKNLKKLKGVEAIKIDVENAFVLLTLSKGASVGENIIREKIKDAGFTPGDILSESD